MPKYTFDHYPTKLELRDVFSHDMSDYTYLGDKEGGANKPGVHGGRYTIEYEVTAGDKQGTYKATILFKQDTKDKKINHDKNIAEFVAGRIMNALIGDDASSIILATRPGQPSVVLPDETGENVYIGSIFYDGFQEFHKIMGQPSREKLHEVFHAKAFQDKISAVNATGKRECIYSNFDRIAAVSLLLGDTDIHSGNFGPLKNPAQLKNQKEKLVKIDHAGALDRITDVVSLHGLKHPFGQPANHFRDFPTDLKINAHFAAELRRQASANLNPVIDTIIDDIAMYYGFEPIAAFLQRMGMNFEDICEKFRSATLPQQKNQLKQILVKNTKSFLQYKMQQRQNSFKQLALEIEISTCFDSQFYNSKTNKFSDVIQKDENGKVIQYSLEKLIVNNPLYFLQGKFHFRGASKSITHNKALVLAKINEQLDTIVENAIHQSNPKVFEYLFSNETLMNKLQRDNKKDDMYKAYKIMLGQISQDLASVTKQLSDKVKHLDDEPAKAAVSSAYANLTNKIVSEILSESQDLQRVFIVERWTALMELAGQNNDLLTVSAIYEAFVHLDIKDLEAFKSISDTAKNIIDAKKNDTYTPGILVKFMREQEIKLPSAQPDEHRVPYISIHDIDGETVAQNSEAYTIASDIIRDTEKGNLIKQNKAVVTSVTDFGKPAVAKKEKNKLSKPEAVVTVQAISKPLSAEEEQQKMSMKFNESVAEFIKTEHEFNTNIKTFLDRLHGDSFYQALKPDVLISKATLTHEQEITLNKFLAPYKVLIKSPFDTITSTDNSHAALKSILKVILNNDTSYQKNISAILTATINHDHFKESFNDENALNIQSPTDQRSAGQFIILPIQRAPRYQDLLKAIQKFDNKADPELTNLIAEAVAKLKIETECINNTKRAIEELETYANKSDNRREIITQILTKFNAKNTINEKLTYLKQVLQDKSLAIHSSVVKTKQGKTKVVTLLENLVTAITPAVIEAQPVVQAQEKQPNIVVIQPATNSAESRIDSYLTPDYESQVLDTALEYVTLPAKLDNINNILAYLTLHAPRLAIVMNFHDKLKNWIHDLIYQQQFDVKTNSKALLDLASAYSSPNLTSEFMQEGASATDNLSISQTRLHDLSAVLQLINKGLHNNCTSPEGRPYSRNEFIASLTRHANEKPSIASQLIQLVILFRKYLAQDPDMPIQTLYHSAKEYLEKSKETASYITCPLFDPSQNITISLGNILDIKISTKELAYKKRVGAGVGGEVWQCEYVGRDPQMQKICKKFTDENHVDHYWLGIKLPHVQDTDFVKELEKSDNLALALLNKPLEQAKYNLSVSATLTGLSSEKPKKIIVTQLETVAFTYNTVKKRYTPVTENLSSYISKAVAGKTDAASSISADIDITGRLLSAHESLEAIGSNGFVHSDIALRNILASGDTDAKIIDLGYAKSITNEKAQDMHTGGPLLWLSKNRFDRMKLLQAMHHINAIATKLAKLIAKKSLPNEDKTLIESGIFELLLDYYQNDASKAHIIATQIGNAHRYQIAMMLNPDFQNMVNDITSKHYLTVDDDKFGFCIAMFERIAIEMRVTLPTLLGFHIPPQYQENGHVAQKQINDVISYWLYTKKDSTSSQMLQQYIDNVRNMIGTSPENLAYYKSIVSFLDCFAEYMTATNDKTTTKEKLDFDAEKFEIAVNKHVTATEKRLADEYAVNHDSEKFVAGIEQLLKSPVVKNHTATHLDNIFKDPVAVAAIKLDFENKLQQLLNQNDIATKNITEEIYHLFNAHLIKHEPALLLPIAANALKSKFGQDKAKEIITELKNKPAIVNASTTSFLHTVENFLTGIFTNPADEHEKKLKQEQEARQRFIAKTQQIHANLQLLSNRFKETKSRISELGNQHAQLVENINLIYNSRKKTAVVVDEPMATDNRHEQP